LTVHAAATTEFGLKVGLAWWLPGMALVTLYFTYAYRQFSGKVSLEQDGH
jgi:cytochrome bd-type quinol oxidase subunit 2